MRWLLCACARVVVLGLTRAGLLGCAWFGDRYGNVQLSCEDIAATADFYVNKLGCTESSRFGDMWLEIKVPGDMTLGFLAVPGAKAQKKSGYRIGFGSSNLGMWWCSPVALLWDV